MIVKIGLLIITMLFAPLLCFAGSTETDRINGAVDFLLKRGKDNYLYIFEQHIKDNKEVQCYFPTIYSYVSDGDLRLLLQSRKIWGESVEADLKNLVVRSTAKELGKAINFKKAALDATDSFLDIAQYLEVTYNNESYPITVVKKDPKDLRDLINGFYTGPVDLRDLLLKIDEKIKIHDTLCSAPTITIGDIKEQVRTIKAAMKDALNKLNAWKNHIEQNKALLSVNVGKLKNACQQNPTATLCNEQDKLLSTRLPGIISNMSDKAGMLVATADALERYLENISRADSNTAKALLAIRFLEEHKAFDEKVLAKFKRHVLFFAELSDAGSADQTREILEAYTMPPVSFAVKRERYQNHVLLTSYLGYGYGKVLNAGAYGEENRKGIYAPIGLEFSRGLGKGDSISLMLAPLDFGYPINLKLNGVKQNIDFNEIVAPSAAVSYGFANYPLCVGVAYQRGRNAAAVNNPEERVLLFIAFDMPLLTFY